MNPRLLKVHTDDSNREIVPTRDKKRFAAANSKL